MGQVTTIPHTQLEWLEIWDRLQAEVMENPELRTNLEHLDRRLAVEALAFGTTAYELMKERYGDLSDLS